jgi:hypothetical protein
VDEPAADMAEALPTTTYEIYLARDPFDPVVPEDAPDAPDPADPDAPAPAPDDPDAPAPDPDDPDAPAPDPDDPDAPRPDPDAPRPSPDADCEGDREEVVCNGEVLSLLEITTDDEGQALAVVQVNSTIYEVRRGQQFADHFRLNSFDGNCVNVLHGDDAFTLCEGERVLK